MLPFVPASFYGALTLLQTGIPKNGDDTITQSKSVLQSFRKKDQALISCVRGRTAASTINTKTEVCAYPLQKAQDSLLVVQTIHSHQHLRLTMKPPFLLLPPLTLNALKCAYTVPKLALLCPRHALKPQPRHCIQCRSLVLISYFRLSSPQPCRLVCPDCNEQPLHKTLDGEITHPQRPICTLGHDAWGTKKSDAHRQSPLHACECRPGLYCGSSVLLTNEAQNSKNCSPSKPKP